MPTDLPPDYKPQPLPGDGKPPPGVVPPPEGEDVKVPRPLVPTPGRGDGAPPDADVTGIPSPAGKPVF